MTAIVLIVLMAIICLLLIGYQHGRSEMLRKAQSEQDAAEFRNQLRLLAVLEAELRYPDEPVFMALQSLYTHTISLKALARTDTARGIINTYASVIAEQIEVSKAFQHLAQIILPESVQ